MSVNSEKNALRKEFSQKRKAIRNKAEADKKIFERLTNSEEFKNCDLVLVYISVKSEVDTTEFIKKCFAFGKKTAVPICRDGGLMSFHVINSFSDLTNSKFGIPEPNERNEIAVSTKETLCVVPGLSFDKSGHRLGYGKGYYDRFLASFGGMTIGLCYDECVCECLPHGNFDKEVFKVITEKTIISKGG